jgi:hypothetical protein
LPAFPSVDLHAQAVPASQIDAPVNGTMKYTSASIRSDRFVSPHCGSSTVVGQHSSTAPSAAVHPRRAVVHCTRLRHRSSHAASRTAALAT